MNSKLVDIQQSVKQQSISDICYLNIAKEAKQESNSIAYTNCKVW